MKNAAVAVAVALLLLVATNAAAEPAADLVDSATVDAANKRDAIEVRGGRRHKQMLLEALAIQAIGTAWYWRNTGDGWGEANVVDWQLGFEGDALTKKLQLGLDGWRFDGNSFELNAIGHPMFGALTYWSARKNNYGVAESFAISTLVSGTWELFTEWAEYGSINDALSTSTTGVAIGEAAYQLMHHWRRANYAVHVGAGTQAGDAMMTAGAHVALDTVPARGAGRIVGGKRIDVALEAAFDGDMRGIEGGAKSSIVGWYTNAERYRLFAGASAEFYYRDHRDRDARDGDLLAMVAVGPTVDARISLGDATLTLGADLYADFGMLKSVAYADYREQNPMAVVRNSMQDKPEPYYYARGFTVDPRIALAFRGFDVGGKLVLSAYDSLDGADRDQEMMTADPHITDTDAFAQGWVGYTHAKYTLALDGRINRRTGTMGGATGEQSASTTMLTVSYRR